MRTFIHEGKTFHEILARARWSLTHYDGAMSMIAQHDGRLVYGRCHQSAESRSRRWFWLYPLTDSEIDAERRYQESVRDFYGFGTDYEDDGRRKKSGAPRKSIGRFWRLLLMFVGRADDLVPSFEELRRAAGVGDRNDYVKREALGFFSPWSDP